MGVKTEPRLITGEEIEKENLRLRAAGIRYKDPQARDLDARIQARDEYLFERYGKPHMDSHYGEWIAISLDGNVAFGTTSSEAGGKGLDYYGRGNYTVRRLAEFTGVVIHH